MESKAKETVAKVKRKAAVVKQDVKGKVAQKSTPDELAVLVTVVARKKTEFYLDLIQSFEVNMQLSMVATGTADASMMRLLGLSDLKKSVIFSVIKESKLNDCLATLDDKFKTIAGGKGIAFTIPMTSVIGTLIYGFLSNNKILKEGN